MAGLEKQVREALIDKEAKRMIKFSSRHPDFKFIIEKQIETVIDAMVDLNPLFGNMDEKEMAMLREEGRRYQQAETLKEIFYEQAKALYTSARQWKAGVNSDNTYFLQGAKKGVIDRYEKIHDQLDGYLKLNDRIVRRLAKIAEKEGVEKATMRLNSVIREFFPTADDYKAFVLGTDKAVGKFLHNAHDVLMEDGEMGRLLGKGCWVVANILDKTQQLGQKMREEYLEKKIKEIYK